MTMLRRLCTAGLLAAMVMVPSTAALGQEELDLRVEEASFLDDGTTQVVVSLTGDSGIEGVDGTSFTVSEAGVEVEGVSADLVRATSETERRTVIVVLDRSGSTEGPALDSAVAAARSFVTSVADAGVDVGLVTFATEATLVQPPTDDEQAVLAALDTVEAGGETAFFDAVMVAARTLQNLDGHHSVVAFTDGADSASVADLVAATSAMSVVGAPVSVVALDTSELDLAPIRQLSEATGGRVIQAGATSELRAAFDEVAASLTNQYVLRYSNTGTTGEFELRVVVDTGASTAEDAIVLTAPRPGSTVGEPAVVAVAPSEIFGNTTYLLIALGALFLGVLIIVGFLLVPAGDQRVARTLERGLRMYRRGEPGGGHAPAGEAAGRVGRGAVGIVAAVPKPEGYDERTQLLLDRAAWPLRAAEFTTLRVIAVLLGILIGWGLFSNIAFGLVIGAAGWVVPRVVLAQRVSARQSKFLEQLPDTLQLLAGSLKAGYGILQGIDTIVKEVPEPTSSEFQRVLTEARLGLALEDALDAMAERIGSEDFRWVTVAINIQRRVGGNLAELLETVAETLREREMVRRQISVLSAEGRLSAMILTALPFGLAGYLTIANPDYIGQLFSNSVGQMMVLGAVVLMAVGVAWMRRLIDIDV